MLFFWLLVLAHGLADFILQTNGISATKCENKWQGYASHGLAVLICTFVAVHFYGWKSALLAAGLVTAAHVALDWLKKGAQLSETAKALFNKAGVLKKTVEEGQ